jgi:hypothetical protein
LYLSVWRNLKRRDEKFIKSVAVNWERRQSKNIFNAILNADQRILQRINSFVRFVDVDKQLTNKAKKKKKRKNTVKKAPYNMKIRKDISKNQLK